MKRHDIFSIQAALADALAKAIPSGSLDTLPPIEKPKDKGHGDFASPAALVLAKKLKRPPMELAQEIVRKLPPSPDLLSEVKVAPPGFINLRLSPAIFSQSLAEVLALGEKYGASDRNRDIHILLEFVSANPTGPLNVVNARAAVLGDCIAKLIRVSGGKVETEYYINDTGNQARLFGESLEAAISRVRGTPKDAPEGGYQGAYMDDLARDYLARDPKLMDADFNTSCKRLGEWGMDRVVQWHREALERYGVQFDQWFSERRGLHDTGLVEKTLSKLKEDGLTYQKDGAVWIKTSEHGAHKDEVLLKSNGIPAYIVA
ncbi:MAG TPA: arginine--tRNA ligase, partial [bacterium]|nr:arginine--tRNA ligase [bacterium]